MNTEDKRLYQLLGSQENCKQQLQTTLDAIKAGNRDIREIDMIVAECADVEPKLALDVIKTLVQAEEILDSDLERSLQAIGETDPDLATEFFEESVDNPNYTQEYIATYLPHLFVNNIEELCTQLKQWYESSPMFFERAVESLLGAYHEARTGSKDLENYGETIVGLLTDIAEIEGIDTSSALNADTDDTLVKGSLILDDFRHQPASNLDSYGIGVDYDTIAENATAYPRLGTLLGSDWVESLESAGSYDLPRFLSHEIDRSDFRAVLRQRNNERDWSQEEFELISIAKLVYLDHCCETIDLNQDSIGSLRQMLLDREKYGDGLAELDVCNALRREFVDHTVTMEPTVAGKDPDFGLLVDGEQIWVEVTRARETNEKRLVGVFSAPSGERSYVRKKVTDKTRDQISAIKQANPDDLTMVVLKNEFSAVDDNLVREYALGPTRFMVSSDLDDPEVYAVSGEPVARKDNHVGSTDDEGIEHLDILANFDYTTNFYSKPFISGQVFAFSDSVPNLLLDRLGEAFNAGSHVYKTPFVTGS
ncbi:hypothetical protein [Natronococcus roseus]|uniref:hypothetical protein n=1 Tax=Natronococcus roseus TaxID=1052014 RepID=UPI00374CA0A9